MFGMLGSLAVWGWGSWGMPLSLIRGMFFVFAFC